MVSRPPWPLPCRLPELREHDHGRPTGGR
uniref:Uncharacterized protein n=1 Tax=Arundo donax TaxID=35708 RepID=A0A0A8XN35_ARUDO